MQLNGTALRRFSHSVGRHLIDHNPTWGLPAEAPVLAVETAEEQHLKE
jgi:hypothetical protein